MCRANPVAGPLSRRKPVGPCLAPGDLGFQKCFRFILYAGQWRSLRPPSRILLLNYRQLCLLVALLSMAWSLSVRAQDTDRAAVHSISGVLLDPSGAAIAKA